MKAKTVKEILNEVKRSEDEWSNREIDKWHMKNQEKTMLPLIDYIDNVIDLISQQLPENLIKYGGLTKEIIADIITEDEDNNVYKYYENNDNEEIAAEALSAIILKYVSDDWRDYN